MHILDQKIVYRQGSFLWLRIWVSGWIVVPDGECKPIMGYTGKETEITFRIVRAIGVFTVYEDTLAQPAAA